MATSSITKKEIREYRVYILLRIPASQQLTSEYTG